MKKVISYEIDLIESIDQFEWKVLFGVQKLYNLKGDMMSPVTIGLTFVTEPKEPFKRITTWLSHIGACADVAEVRRIETYNSEITTDEYNKVMYDYEAKH